MIEQIILAHSKQYPQAKVQDFIKLLYQNEFGGGHLTSVTLTPLAAGGIEEVAARQQGQSPEVLQRGSLFSDKAKSIERIENEMQASAEEKMRLEPIGNGWARLYLSKNSSLTAKTIDGISRWGAQNTAGELASLKQKLGEFLEMVKAGKLPFLESEAVNALEEYAQQGYPVIRHTEAYHTAYQPTYRVVQTKISDYLSLWEKLDQPQKNPLVLAIEGGAASGKTTLGEMIGFLYGAAIFHTDDFFLQPHQRTAQRLAQAGGNIDIERLQNQLMQGIVSRKNFSYQRFDCETMKLSDDSLATLTQITVVEGVYSTHPTLGDVYDWKVFLEISPELQKKRIAHRNSPEKLKLFLSDWIPMENAYFTKFDIKNKANQRFVIE